MSKRGVGYVYAGINLSFRAAAYRYRRLSRAPLSSAPSNKYTMNFIKDLSVDKVLNLAEDTFNQVKPKTDVEARVYEVLSHKNWGSSSTIMNQIARDTYDYDKCESM